MPQVIKCDEVNREVTLTQHVGGKQLGRTYHFDKVFAPHTTQEALFSEAVEPIVEEVLQGFNCTIFAYGQTGTGKTHTMTGDINAAAALGPGAGVMPRAISQFSRTWAASAPPPSSPSSAPFWSCTTRRSPTCWPWGTSRPRCASWRTARAWFCRAWRSRT